MNPQSSLLIASSLIMALNEANVRVTADGNTQSPGIRRMWSILTKLPSVFATPRNPQQQGNIDANHQNQFNQSVEFARANGLAEPVDTNPFERFEQMSSQNRSACLVAIASASLALFKVIKGKCRVNPEGQYEWPNDMASIMKDFSSSDDFREARQEWSKAGATISRISMEKFLKGVDPGVVSKFIAIWSFLDAPIVQLTISVGMTVGAAYIMYAFCRFLWRRVQSTKAEQHGHITSEGSQEKIRLPKSVPINSSTAFLSNIRSSK